MSGAMRVLLGVDPGIHGGLAIVAVEDGAAPRLIEAIDIPVIGTGAKERVDVAAIRDFIDPSELIVSTRSGTSLTRAENAHAPAPGRSEIVRSFSEALKVFQEGSNE